MKKGLFVVMIALPVMMLGGCGEKEQPMAELNVDKYVTLGTYKGLEAETTEVVVEDSYVDAYIEYAMSQSAKLTEVDRKAQLGDTVNIDYVGKKDGVPFDGGTGNGYDLRLGSGTFIPGFEDGLVGYGKGDKVDLDLTFPENYGKAELAGVKVVFSVTVNEVKENVGPSIEEYAKDNGYESVDAYKESVKKDLIDAQQYSADKACEEQLINMLVENSEYKELPDWLKEKYYKKVIEKYTSYAKSNGMTLEVFASQGMQMTMDQLEEQAREQAGTYAKQILACEAVFRAEGMSLGDEDYLNYAKKLGYDNTDIFKEESEEETRDYVMLDKVLTFVRDNAKLTYVSASK